MEKAEHGDNKHRKLNIIVVVMDRHSSIIPSTEDVWNSEDGVRDRDDGDTRAFFVFDTLSTPVIIADCSMPL